MMYDLCKRCEKCYVDYDIDGFRYNVRKDGRKRLFLSKKIIQMIKGLWQTNRVMDEFFVNGMRQMPGENNDYVLHCDHITMNYDLEKGDWVTFRIMVTKEDIPYNRICHINPDDPIRVTDISDAPSACPFVLEHLVA